MKTERKDNVKSKFLDRYFESGDEVIDVDESNEFFKNQEVEVEINMVYDEVSVVKNPSVISSGTVIQGNLNAENDIEIYGQVVGNIITTGMVKVDGGAITGDIKAKKIFIRESVINGNLESESIIDAIDNSKIVGTITGDDIVLNCQCKGNIYANERLKLLESSIITGDIQTKVIKIEEGSYIEGKLKMVK
ncbi:MAG: polymer-forming cytoskeletal protein [Coprobacillus sp.]